MGTQSGGADPDLGVDLLRRGYRFEFFQAVRLLSRLYADREPVGVTTSPAKETVRFRAHQSLAFPPSAVASIRPPQYEGRPAEMTVAFMGLTGPQGVLPRFYTEMVMERLQAKDTALCGFLDVFNHRMISLFYRAWEKHQCFMGFEASLVQGRDDRFAGCLFALAGLGTRGLCDALTIDHRSVLRYVGLIGQRPRSADALARCIADYFQIPVRVTQFVGAWMTLDESDWTTIGVTGQNNVLGRSALAGTKVWDQQAGFKVELGPLDFEEFRGLLPSGTSYPTLVQLTKLFAGPELDFDIQLSLKAGQVPATVLQSSDAYAPRLGWTTWLKTMEFSHDAEDVCFSAGTVVGSAAPA